MAGKLGDPITKIKEFVLVPLNKYKLSVGFGDSLEQSFVEESTDEKPIPERHNKALGDNDDSGANSDTQNSSQEKGQSGLKVTKPIASPEGQGEVPQLEGKRKRRAPPSLQERRDKLRSMWIEL